MLYLTRVSAAVSGNTRDNTITYTFDINYGYVYTNQAVQISGFIFHTEFNLVSAVITSVNTDSYPYTFTINLRGFPLNLSETTTTGYVTGFIDVIPLAGPAWANDAHDTIVRAGDPLIYQVIGKDYSPPTTGAVDPTYTSSNEPGVPTFSYSTNTTTITFNSPYTQLQSVYSSDLQSFYPFTGGGFFSVRLPDLSPLSPGISGAIRFGLSPSFYFDLWKETNGAFRAKSSDGVFSFTYPYPYSVLDFVAQSPGTSVQFNAYNTTSGLTTLATGYVPWNYTSGAFYLYAGTLSGFVLTDPSQSFTFALQYTFTSTLTFQAIAPRVTISSDGNFEPNTATFTLAAPLLSGSTVVLPGWQSIQVTGLTYSLNDILNHPLAATFSQEVHGAATIGVSFNGGLDIVNVGKSNQASPLSFSLGGQTIVPGGSTTNVTVYGSSPDGIAIDTQIGYRGITGSWSNGSYTITISSTAYSSHVIVPNSTYIVQSGYFSPNTLITAAVSNPPNATLTINKPTLQSGSSQAFELRFFQRRTGVNTPQFSLTGISTGGDSGGTVVLQAYSPFPALPPYPVNVFIAQDLPSYPVVKPYLSGDGTPNVLVSAPSGFNTITPYPLRWGFIAVYQGRNVFDVVTNLTILPVTITLTPDPTSPTFQLVRYQPFNYQYSIDGYNSSVSLHLNSVSSNIAPYVSISSSMMFASFASTVGASNTFQSQPVVFDAIVQGKVVGTISNSATVKDFILNVSPSIPGYTLSLYKYEPFANSFSISAPTGLTLNSTGSSPEILTFLSNITSTNIVFASSNGYQTSYSTPLTLSINAVTTTSTVVSNLTISVPVSPGRFYSPMSNTNYVFYVAENLSNTYPLTTDLQFLTLLNLDILPVSSPGLPSGISFGSIDSNTFQLQGIPNVQTSQQNYLVIGSNTTSGKIVTTTVSIQVKAPRISVSGGPTVISGMLPDSPISPSTFTSIIPTTSYAITSNFYYNWNSNLPDGLYFEDINGSNVPPGVFTMFPPDSDTAKTIIIAGTPTVAAATNLVTAGLSSYTVGLTGNTRGPVLNSAVTQIQLTFGELVLFTGTAIPALYATNPMASNTLIFKAGSYFPSTSPIASIAAGNLPPGLSLTTNGTSNYVNGVDCSSGVYVSGTPTTVNLTPDPTVVIAVNQNGTSRTSSVAIPILADVITFDSATPAEGSVFAFIVSRPTYTDYPSGIVFTGVSAAGKSITSVVSYPDLTAYGLTLSSNGTLSGTPTSYLDTTSVSFTATDSLGTTGVRNVFITINPDVYTFTPLTLNFVQNNPIDPVQILASTSSERQVQSYNSQNLPSGLVLSPTGILTGTPLTSGTGTFDVTASTGYDTGTNTYSYKIIADSILTLLTASSLTVPVGPFSIDAFRSITYSEFDAPTSYVVGSVAPANITLAMTNNVLSGNLTGGSGSYIFTVLATYQNASATTVVSLVIANGVGVFTIAASGNMKFISPTVTTYSGLQYVPIQPITVTAKNDTDNGCGCSGDPPKFIYYFIVPGSLPRGLSFAPDPTGTYATIYGTPAVYSSGGSTIVVYAKNDLAVGSISLTLVVTTPFFVNPTSAGAYTALLRNTVEENAAHNSEDNKVFPQSDALRGPLQAPAAPDEVIDRKCKNC
jgi:hypothetical protein